MYTQYFSLKQSPFSIAPDPRYLFMSERHREALAHLLYGIGSGGGFVLLTGEIGAGKTTVCRCFIEQIPSNCRLAYIFNPKLTVEELLLSVCDEFRIPLPAAGTGATSIKIYVDAINSYLLHSHGQGQNNVLVIDEAQNLSAGVLEQLRLLTNLETSERKLLQIVLIGQPELRGMLARPELEQLAQRVIARYHLGSLTVDETGSYIAHRLAVAGAGAATSPFPRALSPLIHQLTLGIPRRINLLCDRALLGAYVEGSAQVTRTILRRAAEEVFAGHRMVQPRAQWQRPRWPLLAAGVTALLAVSAAAGWHYMPARTGAAAVAPAVAAAVAASAAPVPRIPAKAAVPAAAAAAAAAPIGYADEQLALRALAALFDQKLPDGEVCSEGQKAGLRCHIGKGALYELQQLDRPAILTLRDGDEVSYVLLTAMDAGKLTLSHQGRTQVINAGELALRFDGSYTTFWKMPRFYREQIASGEQGADVDWIATRLAYLKGLPPPYENRPLSPAMRQLLRDFQSENNLKVDGVAGPRTFMRLNQLTGVAEPRLLAAKTRQ